MAEPSIDSFNEQPAPSVADFAIEPTRTGMLNQASTANIAAHASVLSDNPEMIAENYQTIRSDLNETGKSATADQIATKAFEQDARATKEALMGIVTDLTLPAEQRQAAAQKFSEMQQEQFGPSLNRLVQEKALAADSKGESVEQGNIRLDRAKELQNISAWNREKQSAVNSFVARGNSDILPLFVEFIQTMVSSDSNLKLANTISEYNKSQGVGSFFDVIKAQFLPGSSREDLKKSFNSLPVDQQRQALDSLIRAVETSTSLVTPDTPDMSAVQNLKAVLEDSDYSKTDKIIDNVATVMSNLGWGNFTAPGMKIAKGGVAFEAIEQTLKERRAAGAARAFEAAKNDAVRTEVAPMSVANTYKDVNPEKYKAAYQAAAADETGQAAEALFGAGRTEAVASAHAPEMPLPDGSVQARPTDVEGDNYNRVSPEYKLDPTIEKEIKTSGRIDLTETEKASGVATVLNDFRSATGITARTEMTTIVDNEFGGKTISAVYGNGSEGFSNAVDAIEQAKLSLRKYGIQDSDIQLLKRSGGVYEPVPPGGAGGNGDYLVRVNYDYNYNPHSTINWDTLNVEWNFPDRLTMETPVSLDPASMFDPVITLGANVAVDKGSRLQRNMLEMGKEFTDEYVKLGRNSKDKVWQFILEANEKGIGLSPLEISKYSFTDKELSSVRKWRRYWDNQYWLENRDYAKTLGSTGYQVLESQQANTRLFAKPLQKAKVGREAVYDVASGNVRTLSAQELDDLYSSGGTVAKLRSHALINGDYVGHAIVENKAGSSYLRAIRETDPVLNYRPGYFTVRYTGPKFVIERVKNAAGEIIGERAIANAKSTRDAVFAAKRQAQSTGKIYGEAKDLKADYYVRGDIKNQRNIDDEHMFDSQVMAGRTAQRVRGKPLYDATTPVNFGPQYNHVMSPVDSLIHAAQSIAKRTSMRDYLEAAKQRAVNQYGHLFPKDEFNRPMWPQTRADIGGKGDLHSKEVADARSTYDYIASLENAAANSFDDLSRDFLNSIADLFGDKASKGGRASGVLNVAERVTRAVGDNVKPTQILKSAGNAAFIATNPIRQLILQPHQALMLLANYPKSAPQAVRDFSAFLMVKTHPSMLKAAAYASQRTEAEVLALIKEIDATGLAAGVDSHSLVSGSLSQMAEMSRYSGRTYPGISSAVRYMRKIGFDMGETVNILSAYLTIRQDAVRQGLKLTPEVLDTVAAKARNYTGNMNAAGDMKFSKGILGVFTQYMQAPFKSAAAATNRVMTKTERARLLGMQAVLFPGINYWAWESFFDKPAEGETRRVLEEGLEGYFFNSMMSHLAGRDVRIDFSSLAPANMYGTWEVIKNLATMKPYDALAATPSGQLVFGSSPRITDALRKASRYFHHVDDITDPEEFLKVVDGFARVSSGYSNAFKAKYMWDKRQKLNSMGGVTVEHVGRLEAIFAAAGFNTMEEKLKPELSQRLYELSTDFRSDIEENYKLTKRLLEDDGISNQDPEFIQRVVTEMYSVVDNPAAMEILNSLIEKDMRKGDGQLFQRIQDVALIPDREKIRETFNRRIPDEEMRKQALDTLDYIDNHFKNEEENQ